MAQIIDLGDQVQVLRDDRTTTFYDKMNQDGSYRLEVRVNGGFVELLYDGEVVERFGACGQITNLNAVTLRDLAEEINQIIRGGTTHPPSGVQGHGTDNSVTRWNGATNIQDSDWFINDEGVLYPGTDPQDIGILGSNRVGNIFMGSNIDYDADLVLSNLLAEKFKFSNSGVFTINQQYSFPTTDGAAGYVLKTDGAGNVTFEPLSLSNARMEVAGKGLPGLVTSVDGDKAVAFTILNNPENNSYITVDVNGKTEIVGNGVKTESCYFSGDGGTTARGFDSGHPNGKVQVGDELYWNGSVADYELDTLDIINIYYITI